MNWAEVNARQDVEHGRVFAVTLRSAPDGERRSIAVRLEAFEIFEMSRHGPLLPQLRAAAINYARKGLAFQLRAEKVQPIGGFQWWGDPIVELVQ
jgi:hypothetical protein